MIKNDTDAVLVSTIIIQNTLHQSYQKWQEFNPKTAHSIESLCNSGTNSIVSAYSYIASGLADMVLISGAERYDSPGQILQWDNSRGEYKHPIFWASIFTKSYKRKYSISDEESSNSFCQKSQTSKRKSKCIIKQNIHHKRCTEF